MTVLVTGAAGFIGSHLAQRLLARGEDVIGLDCLTDYYDVALKRRNLEPLLGHRNFRLEQLDLAEAELRSIVSDVSCVYHLAGQPGVRGSWGDAFDTYVRNNITATQLLLEAMPRPSARLVFASSSSVYGDADATQRPRTPCPFRSRRMASRSCALSNW